MFPLFLSFPFPPDGNEGLFANVLLLPINGVVEDVIIEAVSTARGCDNFWAEEEGGVGGRPVEGRGGVSAVATAATAASRGLRNMGISHIRGIIWISLHE